MCDRPSNSDQDFCDDVSVFLPILSRPPCRHSSPSNNPPSSTVQIDDELCDKNENQLSNSQISLCDWLNDTLSSKKTEAAARLSKIAPVLRAGVKK